uniref:Apple domain-containing protein n=1 Tax=Magallana gigas TaxID=29159 RepID=A0A8W8N7F3_MAGGI
MKTNEECGALCTSQNNCKGYGHNSVTLACYVSANDDPSPDTYSWNFYTKMCLKDLLALLPTTEEITTTEMVTTNPTTIRLTTIVTTEDTTTVPLSTDYASTIVHLITTEHTTEHTTEQTSIQTTEQTTEQTTDQTTERTTIPTTERTTAQTTIQTTEQTTIQTTEQSTEQTTRQTTKLSTEQTTEQTTAIQTTEQTTALQTTKQTTSLQTTTSTTTGPDFISSYCTCTCEESDLTVSERIEERRQDLQLSVRELSAFKRKLICAPDFRPSANNIGSIGVFILVTWGFLFAFPDIIRAVHVIRRLVKKGRS